MAGELKNCMTVSEARERFAKGLDGSWASYLGGGHDMLIGMRLVFRKDGSGKMEEWGFDHSHLNPEYVGVADFRWDAVADHAIAITYRGETRTVSYDFRTCRNEYDVAELRVFEVGAASNEKGEAGFWLSPVSLVCQGPEEPSQSVVTKIWKKLTS